MDPASAIGLVGSIINIADGVLKTANRLSLLQTKYRQADVSVSLLIGQMFTIQTALKQLAELQQDNASSLHLLGSEGGDGLTISLDGCGTLFASLNEYLNDLERRAEGELSVRGKLFLLWRENEIKEYLAMLDRHVNALNLLLHVMQCKSLSERRTLLEDEDSITILRLARESTESLYPINTDSLDIEQRSIFSQDTSNLSAQFDFDHVLLGSRAYHAAFKINFRDLIHQRANSRHPYAATNNEALPEPPAALDECEATRNMPVENPSAIRDSPLQSLNSDQSMRFKRTGASRESKPLRLRQLRNYALALSPLSFPRRPSENIRKSQNVEPVDSSSSLSSQSPPPEYRTLLLGTSESGKSTLLKAFKLVLEADYSPEVREASKEIIFSNVVQSMRVVLETMEALDITLEPYDDGVEIEHHVHTIFMQPAQMECAALPSDVSNALKALWPDGGVQRAYGRRRMYQLNSSSAYYLNDISRIGSPEYVPDTKDILMSRVKTTGITETTFIDPHASGFTWRMFDVGGVRSERKKWIHCFESVDLIFFTVDICCYDKLLFEDETVNRMQEALTLWDSIVNSRWFLKTSFVLVFTHTDQLASCIAESPPYLHFQDFPKGFSVKEYEVYIRNIFLDLVKGTETRLRVRVMFESLSEDPVGTASRILQHSREAVLAQRAQTLIRHTGDTASQPGEIIK